MNILVQVILCSYVFVSLGQVPRRGIPESQGRCIFNLLKSDQKVVHVLFTKIYLISISGLDTQ